MSTIGDPKSVLNFGFGLVAVAKLNVGDLSVVFRIHLLVNPEATR